MHPGYADDAMELFVARVQQYSGLETRTEVDRAARATLRALADCLSAGQMRELAGGLPEDLRSEVDTGPAQAKGFEKGAFLDQVSGGVSTVDTEEVERQARAVLRALREWAPEGASDDAVSQLPPDLAQLFQSPPPRPGG